MLSFEVADTGRPLKHVLFAFQLLCVEELLLFPALGSRVGKAVAAACASATCAITCV